MCKAMEDLRNESYAEGREEGRESQAKDTAVRMSKKGISVEEIAEIVGFSIDKVKKWLVTEVQKSGIDFQEKRF